MPCAGHDIAWRHGKVRSLCSCGWLSSSYDDIADAIAEHAQHAPGPPAELRTGPVSISLLRADQIDSPRRHWHVIETNRKTRLLAKARIVAEEGVAEAHAAFRTLTDRTSDLLLHGWRLDLTESDDRRVVLTTATLTATVEVNECWELSCVASLRASTLATAGSPSL
jgi:hypothetical protein